MIISTDERLHLTASRTDWGNEPGLVRKSWLPVLLRASPPG